MNLLYTLTAYAPFWGGAQLLMHSLARELLAEHAVRVVTQWDTPRSDWLLGATLNAPRETIEYDVDGVPVRRIGVPASAHGALRPWVYGYWAAQGEAIERISGVLADIAPDCAKEASCLLEKVGEGMTPVIAARSTSLADRLVAMK